MTRSDRSALLTILFALFISAVMQVPLANTGDKDWLLYAARQWIAGGSLYTDIVEVNPPLILWLYGLAVWIAQHVPGLKDVAALGLMGLFSCGISVWLCTWLIRWHPAFEGDKRRRIEFALLLAAIFVIMTPQIFFFDREHILVVMTFPYVLRFMPSLARVSLPFKVRIPVGCSAALGFCIKPHSILLFVTVQLLFLLRERRMSILWSLENLIVYLGAAIYLFCVWHFAPEYIHVILPAALATYAAFNRSGSSLMGLPPAMFCFVLTFADFRRRYTSPFRRDIYYFLAAAAAFLVHAIVSNGWDYTYHPLLCMLLFLSGWVMWEYQWLKTSHEAQGLPANQFIFGMRGCALSLASQGIYVLLMTYVSIGALGIQYRCERSPKCFQADPYVRYVREHGVKGFGTITLDYPRWLQLVHHSNARWETRFNHLWMLPQLLKEKDDKAAAAKHAWILNYVGGALADDLDRHKPDIVFVDTGRQFFAYPNYYDLKDYLSDVPQFKAAWSHYRFATTIDSCDPNDEIYFKAACRYDIYSRIP